MKILVVGGSGMLGSDLCAEVEHRGHELEAPGSQDLDITDPTSIASIASQIGRFDWCINCAAYTAVDKAESEIRQATELNTLGPGYLSNACGMAGIKFIHVSTDFVFSGAARAPYGEESPTGPLGVYGRTKRDGELALLEGNPNALIVRTSWLYGPHGSSFPRTMIRAWEQGRDLRVVADQTGCPTYTADLSRVLVDLVECNAFPGIYHACGPTVSTWHSFAVQAISCWQDFSGSQRPIEVTPIPTEAYPTPAKRPKFSVLSTKKLGQLGIEPMRPLDDALRDFVCKLVL